MISKPLPSEDLARVMTQASEAFAALRGARIFVTGGTGFFGHWLVESLLLANRKMALGARVTLLTRNAEGFRAASPWITEDAAVMLLEGDVRSFDFPAGAYTHVIHAATDSGGQQSERSPAELHNDILSGTGRVLDFAHAAAVRRFLYVSTGAVYGRSTQLPHTPESYLEDRDMPLPDGSYERTKRAAETLCLERTAVGPLEPELDFPLECVIARPFAFVGPRLPLETHFAIGNFIGSALRGEAIVVKGDGTPRRSWMYMSDLAVWLWTLLVRGEPGRAYNVGSEEGYSIAEAAHLVAETLTPGAAVEIAGASVEGAISNSYVPSVGRARVELGLQVTVPLAEALRRTARWYREG